MRGWVNIRRWKRAIFYTLIAMYITREVLGLPVTSLHNVPEMEELMGERGVHPGRLWKQ